MVRAGDVKLFGGILICLGCAPAMAAQPASRSFVVELQAAEQAVASAIETDDPNALRRQSIRISNLIPQLPESEDLDVRASCGIAIGALANIIEDIKGLPPLRSRIAFARDWQSYITHVGPCERAVGLPPPTAPNLR